MRKFILATVAVASLVVLSVPALAFAPGPYHPTCQSVSGLSGWVHTCY